MRVYSIRRQQRISCPGDVVFAFFADPANLELLTPSWLHFRMLTAAPVDMRVGTQIRYVIRWRGLPVRWLTEIAEWVPGRRFVDVQLRGPYRLWHHTHTFECDGESTHIEDLVRYALPGGPIGRIAHALLVKRDIERIFDFRAQQIETLLGPQGPGVVARIRRRRKAGRD